MPFLFFYHITHNAAVATHCTLRQSARPWNRNEALFSCQNYLSLCDFVPEVKVILPVNTLGESAHTTRNTRRPWHRPFTFRTRVGEESPAGADRLNFVRCADGDLRGDRKSKAEPPVAGSGRQGAPHSNSCLWWPQFGVSQPPHNRVLSSKEELATRRASKLKPTLVATHASNQGEFTTVKPFV